MRILLVEDHPEMASVLTAAFTGYDMVVDCAASFGQAQAALETTTYSAILLDRQLPDGDGLALIPHMRRMGIQSPVIVLTSRGDLDERIKGLNIGADDYLGKPFAIEELLARLRAVMRRPPDLPAETLKLGRLSYDTEHRQVSVDDVALNLPRRELLVLETLLKRSGRTVQRGALDEAVYGFDDEIQSNALDAHISRLRRRLADAGAGVEIYTIRGIGYLIKRAS
jgi:DNA-binding response OmpR family regulator